MDIGRFVLIIALGIEALNISGQPKPKAAPRFEDYSATDVFAGQPVPPKIVTSSHRRYRTRIREGVEKGWGVFGDGVEQNKTGPNFAGDMIVIQWGCGAPCLMAAVVNARTGEVSNPPLAIDDTLALPILNVGGDSPGRNPELEFRKNSRLMIVSATPKWFVKHPRSYRHYFVLESNQWVLVYKQSLD